ncbi:hypothetical protein QNH20_24060 [Neobacillus sp. WH10]|uniref:hypothetical protein n=1 Tax=Neobacillus sp. WH10 TaxID=3047873 RepID=UPI0024C15250|nr:hypothetical protein [Neobacillus sp. WH10]WHY77122.1 hypothetical protein QNH20_24060 [Neobacillus sp. WH10]
MKRTVGSKVNKKSYKLGETVTGVRAVIPSIHGKEESGKVIYKRKADYREDPYQKRA